MSDIEPQAKPSKLGKSLLLAVGAGLVALVIAVLPAEYGIDPTGIGKALGLTELSEPVSPIDENIAIVTEGEYLDGPVQFPEQDIRSRTVVIPIDDLGQVEYKLAMPAGATIVYTWRVLGETPNDGVYFDFHGHPPIDGVSEMDNDFATTFSEGEMPSQKGSLTAPFAGNFGWFFLNLEERAIDVELTFTGFYDTGREVYRSVDGLDQEPLEY